MLTGLLMPGIDAGADAAGALDAAGCAVTGSAAVATCGVGGFCARTKPPQNDPETNTANVSPEKAASTGWRGGPQSLP